MTQILTVEGMSKVSDQESSQSSNSIVTDAITGEDNAQLLQLERPKHGLTHTTLPGLSSSTTTGVYPQVILFGDSITQFGVADLQTPLQNDYIRRADMINRGFSGYTAELAIKTISRFLPLSTPSPAAAPWMPPIKLLTLFFGANDACLPGTGQHVPLSSYLQYLTKIINYPILRQHGTKVILITPPPVNEHQLGMGLILRNAITTATYAYAARNLAKGLKIPHVDLWSLFMRRAGFDPPATLHGDEKIPGNIDLPENETLKSFLVDGLHLTSKGYQVLHEELMTVIRRDVPTCSPENLPFVESTWREALGLPLPPSPPVNPI